MSHRPPCPTLFPYTTLFRSLPALLDRRWVVGDLGCGTGELSAALAPFVGRVVAVDRSDDMLQAAQSRRSEEHTSELQSRLHLVCRLLLEKKKKARRELEARG